MSSYGNSRLSMNSFHRLQRRELTGKLPNSFWDYHLHALPVHERVTDLVIANDIICVFCNARLIPFGREGEISPLMDEYGKPIILNCPMAIEFAYYNSNDNSLIIVGYHEYLPYLRILSLEVATIKAGRINEYREIYSEEADTITWDLDIANCRGIIYNEELRVLKIFDLKEYNEISTIQVERKIDWYFQSRGNMYVVMYFNGWGISFKFFWKQNGELCREAIVYLNPRTRLHFATICGDDRICLQQRGRSMELIDISDEVPRVVPTNFEAMVEPYYLTKLDRFLCYTTNQRLLVCNMRGDILITFEDHPMRMPAFTENDFYRGNYITSGQDIIISVCSAEESDYRTINISSIVTGECVAKITTDDDGSEVRQAALSGQIVSLAYNERSGEIFTANEKRICCIWSKNFPSDDRRLPRPPAVDPIE